jgi:hypothetical protein
LDPSLNISDQDVNALAELLLQGNMAVRNTRSLIDATINSPFLFIYFFKKI